MPWEKAIPHRGLKARDATGRRGFGYQQRGYCWEGRESFCRSRLSSSVQVLAAFQAAGLQGLLTQGIGLRPKPWAGLSQPVGPEYRQYYSVTGP